mmetsp:Transcript_63933/g.150418  ORF Transcript_63933/g.150418 Transcript_63933/m.150418 type:complete len:323 (-) Transcript_63933:170-1138(-)|eukprot:CAMPEP_0177720230 /NCGR_PEP_ID=MMETSP0484_2-20121128/16520_1 /TAXON_ID=354590 /ORGANISM="Rhodomonas lens, Strain RHODO" /LENGTH=322 /DNA_ID=CAMNT_0019232489 /DNA_START=74 /DNA_END=1045 /DNA_ORIENTATION=+
MADAFAANACNKVNDLSLPELYKHLASTGLVKRLLELARDEDLGEQGDVTCKVTLEESKDIETKIVSREQLVVSGLAIIPDAIEIFAPGVMATTKAEDGAFVEKGTTLVVLKGPSHEMLRLERTVLNLMSRMSGIATRVRDYHQAILTAAGKDCKAKLLDTRKTTPGLRVVEKYAVRCGGGYCHRLGLHDAVLIKDNHLSGLSPPQVAEMVLKASKERDALVKKGLEIKFFEVEVDTLEQLDAVLSLPTGAVDIILCDNFNCEMLSQAVQKRDVSGKPILLEASGGVNIKTIGAIACTGVDRISVGGLTHQATSIDLGLDAA